MLAQPLGGAGGRLLSQPPRRPDRGPSAVPDRSLRGSPLGILATPFSASRTVTPSSLHEYTSPCPQTAGFCALAPASPGLCRQPGLHTSSVTEHVVG